ncbi:dynamin family protein [Clostridium perfringens]|uniref:dynamin family protein n=1 Tax=Clostridium perfringens TaxID=1502 RepID=UPI0018E49076|nr:dynamin family protein [Clostridium perfringens]MBI6030034.1 dynamin family protein [Clostridium perfringens]
MLQDKFEVIIENITKKSPVRNLSKTSKNFREFYSVDIGDLKKIENELEVIYNKINNPLKVVFMGEVKAGKSTIINSIVGEALSYVDVVEATAAIIEISHGFRDEAIIETYEENNIVGSIDEINCILEENKNNEDFFSSIKVIKIKKNMDSLNKINIVDTPGLETITFVNEERTKNYIQESDVVIWVLNSNHLGQIDVNEKIEEVYDLGKPIICIANRIDEIDGSTEDVIEYIDDEMGYMFEKIIPMSGKLAYEGIINKDNNRFESSGMKELMNSLKSINSNNEAIQNNSIVKSFNVQVDRDIRIHEKISSYFCEIDNDLKERFNNFDKYKNELDKEIFNKVNQWFENDFLTIEIDEIVNSKNPEQKARGYLSETYIKKKINEFIKELKFDIEGKWGSFVSSEMMNHIKSVEIKHNDLAIRHLNDIQLLGSIENNKEEIVKEATEGAVIGGKIGAVIAGYTAFLGPAAAHVTLIGALGGTLPPLIIGGALIKGAMYLKNKKNIENKSEQLKEKLLNAKSEFKRNYFNKILEISKGLNNKGLSLAKKSMESEVLVAFKNMDIYSLDKVIESIEEYIESIKNLNEVDTKVWVIDTNVFIDEPNILELFNDDEAIVISKQVLVELDNKKRDKLLRKNVQKALDNINNRNNIIFDDIENSAISIIYIENMSPDNYILNSAIKYKKMNVELLTSDKNLIAKCKAEDIKAISLHEFKEEKNII